MEVGDSETEPKSFLSGTKQPHLINGLTAEAYLCQKNVQNNIEPNVFRFRWFGCNSKEKGIDGTFGWLQAPATNRR